MTPSGPPRDRLLLALLAFVGVAVLLLGVAVLFVRRQAAPPPAPAATTPAPEPASPVDRTAWSPVSGAALQRATDVAFAGGAVLSTDGRLATYDAGDGAARPVEVPAPIARVFGAAGKLFAAGENEGAPFLILLAPGGEPTVVPMPCAVSRLAGEGLGFAGACADHSGLALSADGGRSFRSAPLELPVPAGAEGAQLDRAVEAVAVSAAGAVAVATSQRWQAEGSGSALLWTLGEVALRPAGAKAFRFASVPALVRTVGLHLAGGTTTLAGLEVDLDGPAEGWVRPRLFRGTDGEPPIPAGEPGPECGTALDARLVDGLLLGPKVAVFRCAGGLVTTLDGGRSWRTERALGLVELVRGGEGRLFARAGERAWERRFVDRAESGATAIRLGAAPPALRRDAGLPPPLAASYDIREPAPDAGPDDAGPADATP